MLKYFLMLIFVTACLTKSRAQTIKDNSARTEFIDSLNSLAKRQTYIQQIPKFKNGPGDLYDYLQSHIVYPEKAKKEDLSAQVFVTFVINGKTGLPRNVKIVQSSNKLFEAETLRLIKNMPAWTPAKADGKSVDMSLTIPVYFHLH